MNNLRIRFSVPMACALVGAALVLAACGDDDDDDKDKSGDTAAETTGGDQLTKAELISQADAICKKGDEEQQRAAEQEFEGQTEQPSGEQLAPFYKDTVVPNIEQQINDVAALEPPADLQSQWDEFISSARTDLGTAKELADDPERLQKVLSDEEDPFAKTQELAQGIGLKECAAD